MTEERDRPTDPAIAMVRRWMTSRAGLRAGEQPAGSRIAPYAHALVAAVRGALAGGRCARCGRAFRDALDIRLDCTALPRDQDAALLPPRASWLLCAACAWSQQYGLAVRWIGEHLRARRPRTPARPTAPACVATGRDGA
jgi:hypothetical protein